MWLSLWKILLLLLRKSELKMSTSKVQNSIFIHILIISFFVCKLSLVFRVEITAIPTKNDIRPIVSLNIFVVCDRFRCMWSSVCCSESWLIIAKHKIGFPSVIIYFLSAGCLGSIISFFVACGEISESISQLNTNNTLINLLPSISLLYSILIPVVGIGINRLKSKNDVVIIIGSFLGWTRLRCIPWELLLKLRLVGVFGHWGLIAADGEVTVFISYGRRMFDGMWKILLFVFRSGILVV